jgi:hypothetical protein
MKASGFKLKMRVGVFGFEAWNFSGAWMLELGIF